MAAFIAFMVGAGYPPAFPQNTALAAVAVLYSIHLLGVKGLVRNLSDGSVEIFAEAGEDVLEKFIRAIDVKGRLGTF